MNFTNAMRAAAIIASAVLCFGCGMFSETFEDNGDRGGDAGQVRVGEVAASTTQAAAVAVAIEEADAGNNVEAESRNIPYNREEWLSGWGPGSRDDGLNTRHEILEDQSFCGVERAESFISEGCWVSVYDSYGDIITDPGDLHIDHIVPLAEAHRSGGSGWSSDQKRVFANDKANLIAVSSGSNMIKSDSDPSEWMPSRFDSACPYLRTWVHIKNVHGLSSDPDEERFVEMQLGFCEGENAGLHDHMRSLWP